MGAGVLLHHRRQQNVGSHGIGLVGRIGYRFQPVHANLAVELRRHPVGKLCKIGPDWAVAGIGPVGVVTARDAHRHHEPSTDSRGVESGFPRPMPEANAAHCCSPVEVGRKLRAGII